MKKERSQAKLGAERTRRSIVKLLKHHGAMDALHLANELHVTAMAVRQHLYRLQEEGLVSFSEEPRSMGRPAKMWALTSEANRLFPDGYADLTISLIESMKEAFGEDGLDRMLDIRNRNQIMEYQSKVSKDLTLKERLNAFAASRTAEGYMAEIIENEDGSYSFVEKHCPICEAARACSGLCKKEVEMFKQVLGADLEITRSEHILEGDIRCVYVITPPIGRD
ncbi:MAG: transcriptional regulator [Paenibacillus sp.]|uniref:Transcriptional regulator n=1 Tax=Paenibacillus aquistagni TaxID=1852522 RepID=A0A1X7J907_9BACL|nr:metalloregulator ArsR/SmtB family transcription factor [Paenibacillus aquistagni]MBR2567636.1 transcriptional regulator [Paenibacillus sp.]SMG24244.1 transcriptional regulator [Paenibacillus aquistagni]